MRIRKHNRRSGRTLQIAMKHLLLVSSALALLFGLTAIAAAGDFDGSQPVLCSVVSVTECTLEDGCRAVTPESVAVPRFLRVDFDKKIVVPADKGGGDRSSAIKRMERIGGQLILQGADEGIQDVRDSVGWTASVSEETGKLVVTAAGNEVAFIVYGACISMP
jgi:hypothetical protein